MTLTKRLLQATSVLLAGAAFAFGAVTASAATLFETSFDTTTLPALAAGDHYTAYFALTGTSGGVVLLTQLSAGIGGTLGTQNVTGSATSSAHGAMLKSSSFVSEFTQDFTPGDHFDFVVDLSKVAVGAPDPDSFTFAILDSTGAPLPSYDQDNGFALTTIDLTKTDYDPWDFNVSPLVDGPFISPEVTEANPVPTPELSPNLAIAVLAGCLALAIGWRRRRVFLSDTH
ncbi:MAG: hypothetical protein JWQ02_3621 [Capsulimonas sp.]|nr:hypothetical protein [Capsulimonas sp.]